MRLKLSRIGTPYIDASITWRLMRWLIPIGLFFVALLPDLYLEFARPKPTVLEMLHHTPRSANKMAINIFFLMFVPTLLMYRFVIFIGERFWTRNPIHGAIALVAVTALLPPFANNLLVQRTINNLEFVEEVPTLENKVVFLESNYCAEECLRLLYSSKAAKVVIETVDNSLSAEHKYPIYSFRLGSKPDCNFDWYGVKPEVLEAYPGTAAAMEQIVAGNCIIQEQVENFEADFFFRPRWTVNGKYYVSHPSEVEPPSLYTHGIRHASFGSLSKIIDGEKTELVRVVGSYQMEIAQYPSALVYSRRFVLKSYGYNPQKFSPIENKLVKIGLHYAPPELIDIKKSKAMVLDLIQNTARPLTEAEKYFIRHHILRLKENGLTPSESKQLQLVEADERIDEP